MDLKAIHYMYFNSSIFTAMATSVILLKPLVLFLKKKKKGTRRYVFITEMRIKVSANTGTAI